MGRATMNGFEKIRKNKNVLRDTKIRLVKAMVFPVALYNATSETCFVRKLLVMLD